MNNYTISCFPNQEDGKAALIELKGELSIQNIKEIKAEIEKTIEKFDAVEFLIYEATMIDLSILQYLISLKKSEKLLQKTFKFSFELDEDLNELMNQVGFKNIDDLI
jgi:anti-anti-sigma regulatory factor